MHDVRSEFPGEELVRKGTLDLVAGRESEAALALAMAASRLRAVGIEVPECGCGDPAHRLYEVLSEHDAAGAHSRYNALVRRLVSFLRAAEHASPG